MHDVASALSQLAMLAPPKTFHAWSSLCLINAMQFINDPLHACSIGDHVTAPLFRDFIAPRLRGRVLDIGCGPYALPIYLESYPLDLIAGIDPLPPHEPHLFEFQQGIAEFLPWPDATFDCVVSATSLDHMCLLDRALAEIHRVLTPEGLFLDWQGFIAGAARYDPRNPPSNPVDRFHLFHFDRPWYEEFLHGAGFTIVTIEAHPDRATWFYCWKRVNP